MSISGIGGSTGYNPYVVMNSSQQTNGMQRPQGGPPPGASGAGGTPPSKEDMYAKVDSDGDSYISQSEMAGVLSMGQSDELSDDGIAMFEEADIDGDGQLSQEEFNTQMEALRDEMGPPPDGGQRGQTSGTADISASTGVDLYSLIQNFSDSSSSYGGTAIYA